MDTQAWIRRLNSGLASMAGLVATLGGLMLAVPAQAENAQPPAEPLEEQVQVQRAFRAPRLLPQTCPQPAVRVPSALTGRGTSATVRVHVTRDGQAAHAELVHSSSYPVLDDATLVVLARCHYRPSAQAGRTLAGTTEVVYHWPAAGPGPIERAALVAAALR